MKHVTVSKKKFAFKHVVFTYAKGSTQLHLAFETNNVWNIL